MHIEITNPVIENRYIVPSGMVADIQKRTSQSQDPAVTEYLVDINFVVPIKEELNKMTLRFSNEREMNLYLKYARKNFHQRSK